VKLLASVTAVSIAATGLFNPALTAAPAAAASGCARTLPGFVHQLTHTASRKKIGWVASDGFSSVGLAGGKSLFMFGDTLYGTHAGKRLIRGRFQRNTAAVYTPTRSPCVHVFGGAHGSGVLPTPHPSHAWYWPGTPIRIGKTVIEPASFMRSTGAGSMAFRSTRDDLITIKVSATAVKRTRVRTLALAAQPATGSASRISWSAGTYVDGSWTYFAGSSLRHGMYGHDIVLARILTADVAHAAHPGSAAQYLTTAGWSRSADYASLRHIVDGSGDATVSMIAVGGQVHIVYKQYSALGDTIVDTHARSWDGQYQRTVLTAAPVVPGTVTYSLNLHPEFGIHASTVWATLNHNAWSGSTTSDVSLYQPSVLRLTLPT